MNVHPNMTPAEFELARLRECERAWMAVFDLCHTQDPNFSDLPGKTGMECVLLHIRAVPETVKPAYLQA